MLEKSCGENQTTQFSENRAVITIMWKNTVEYNSPPDGNIPRRMRFACWITTARDKFRICTGALISP